MDALRKGQSVFSVSPSLFPAPNSPPSKEPQPGVPQGQGCDPHQAQREGCPVPGSNCGRRRARLLRGGLVTQMGPCGSVGWKLGLWTQRSSSPQGPAGDPETREDRADPRAPSRAGSKSSPARAVQQELAGLTLHSQHPRGWRAFSAQARSKAPELPKVKAGSPQGRIREGPLEPSVQDTRLQLDGGHGSQE